jgi:hypothetical protein
VNGAVSRPHRASDGPAKTAEIRHDEPFSAGGEPLLQQPKNFHFRLGNPNEARSELDFFGSPHPHSSIVTSLAAAMDHDGDHWKSQRGADRGGQGQNFVHISSPPSS